MNFEDALKQLRLGAKIRHPSFPEDEYLMACYVTINPIYNGGKIESKEELRERGISITKMKGDKLHPDMVPIGDIDDFTFKEPCKHGYCPQINLLTLIQDDWELYE